MANSYTTFAEILPLPREAALYAVALDYLLEALDRQEDDLPKSFEIEVADFDAPYGRSKVIIHVTEKMVTDARAILEEHEVYGTGVNYEIGNGGLYIASDGSADLEVLTDIIQAAMAQFAVPGAVSIQWADTCDKQRAGEFGGGACVITKDDVHWMSTNTWVADKCRELGIQPDHLVAETAAQG